MTDEIRKLTALEAIRCRAGMYVQPDGFGSVADQLLQASLCHPLAELSCGSASSLTITLKGLSAMISDDGHGWPVHEIAGGRRFAERLLSDLYACRDHKQHAELAHALCRISLPVVVALSETFTLDIHRGGQHWQQAYCRGVAAGPLAAIAVSQTSGTNLSFSLDPQFCDGSLFSSAAVSAWLDTLPPEVPRSAITIHST